LVTIRNGKRHVRNRNYADPTKDLSFTTREARLQDQKNRQNSIETDDEVIKDLWEKMQDKVIREAKVAYTWAVSRGIAKEVARAVLPEGLTMSRMYVNGTIRSWLHYIDIRSDVATQKEHREIAMACAKAIAEIFPMITEFTHAEEDRAE